MTRELTKAIRLDSLARPIAARAPSGCNHPVYAVTKNDGMVPAADYFKKQVHSRDVEGYKVVARGQFAYATIHLDEGSIGVLDTADHCLISPMYTVFEVDKSRVHAPYLLRLLKSRWALSQYSVMGSGSVHRRRSISFETLGRLEVRLPTIPEQQRIANVLSGVDVLRRKRRQAIHLADRILEGSYLEIASKQEERITVEHLLADVPNAARTGPFGSQLLVSEFQETGVPVLGIDNVVQNRFLWAGRRFISQEKYVDLKRYTVRPGDVMVTIMGTTGKVAIAPEDLPACISTKHLCTLTLDRSLMLPEYLWASLRWDPEVHAQTKQKNQGAIMEGWNMGIVKALEIRRPPVSLQKRFAAQVAAIGRLQSKTGQFLDRVGELSDSIASEYFDRQGVAESCPR